MTEEAKVSLGEETLKLHFIGSSSLKASVEKEFNKKELGLSCSCIDVLKSTETLYYYFFLF